MKTRAHPSLQMTLLARTELGELGVSGPIDLWPVAASCLLDRSVRSRVRNLMLRKLLLSDCSVHNRLHPPSTVSWLLDITQRLNFHFGIIDSTVKEKNSCGIVLFLFFHSLYFFTSSHIV